MVRKIEKKGETLRVNGEIRWVISNPYTASQGSEIMRGLTLAIRKERRDLVVDFTEVFPEPTKEVLADFLHMVSTTAGRYRGKIVVCGLSNPAAAPFHEPGWLFELEEYEGSKISSFAQL